MDSYSLDAGARTYRLSCLAKSASDSCLPSMKRLSEENGVTGSADSMGGAGHGEVQMNGHQLRDFLIASDVRWVDGSEARGNRDTDVEFMWRIHADLAECKQTNSIVVVKADPFSTDPPSYKLIPRQMYDLNPTMAIPFGESFNLSTYSSLLTPERKMMIRNAGKDVAKSNDAKHARREVVFGQCKEWLDRSGETYETVEPRERF